MRNIGALTIWFFIAINVCHVYSDRGDIFLNADAASSLFLEGEFNIGGQLGLEIGLNERTDLMGSADILITPAFSSDEGFLLSKYFINSLFTPYFGDIRPRIGGLVGLAHYLNNQHDINEVMPLIGANLQAMVSISSSLYLMGEVAPYIAFGKEGFFDTELKVGLRFRLSK